MNIKQKKFSPSMGSLLKGIPYVERLPVQLPHTGEIKNESR